MLIPWNRLNSELPAESCIDAQQWQFSMLVTLIFSVDQLHKWWRDEYMIQRWNTTFMTCGSSEEFSLSDPAMCIDCMKQDLKASISNDLYISSKNNLLRLNFTFISTNLIFPSSVSSLTSRYQPDTKKPPLRHLTRRCWLDFTDCKPDWVWVWLNEIANVKVKRQFEDDKGRVNVNHPGKTSHLHFASELLALVSYCSPLKRSCYQLSRWYLIVSPWESQEAFTIARSSRSIGEMLTIQKCQSPCTIIFQALTPLHH